MAEKIIKLLIGFFFFMIAIVLGIYIYIGYLVFVG
jgi:hypothetical protein